MRYQQNLHGPVYDLEKLDLSLIRFAVEESLQVGTRIHPDRRSRSVNWMIENLKVTLDLFQQSEVQP